MPISIGALVSVFFTLGAECVVTLSMIMFSNAMRTLRMAAWCHGIDSSANLKHQLFHCQSLFFVSNFAKPSFVPVCLVDEVPEDVIKLLHVSCTITSALQTPSFCLTRSSDQIS